MIHSRFCCGGCAVEHATRAALIISIPGLQSPPRSAALVEFVDIMPTLVQAAIGDVVPQCPPTQAASRGTAACTEGTSLLPLMQSPASKGRAAAFSQYPRVCNDPESKPGSHTAPCPCTDATSCAGDVMGYTMRVDSYRYTEWVRFSINSTTPDWSVEYGRELYDHSASPVPSGWAYENANVAGEQQHASLVGQLSTILRKCAVRPDLCSDADMALR